MLCHLAPQHDFPLPVKKIGRKFNTYPSEVEEFRSNNHQVRHRDFLDILKIFLDRDPRKGAKGFSL